MRVDAHVARGAGQTLALAVRYVLLCLGVTVLFGHSKIDHEDGVGVLGPRTADQEIVWLDVTVDEVAIMDTLHQRNLVIHKEIPINPLALIAVKMGYHVPGKHRHRFNTKASMAHVEEIF